MLQELTDQERRSVDGGRINLNSYTPLNTAWVVAAPRTPEGLGNVTRFFNFGDTYDASKLMLG